MAVNDWSPIFKGSYDPLKAGSIDATDTEPHDRGIIRAMNAKYKPNKSVEGDPRRTVFISRLNPKTDEETIERVFSKYGVIKRFRLVRDIVTGFSRGYAFVEYEEHIAAESACRKAYKHEIDGCEIFVDYECERVLKGWIPRRKGGGLGGKKESGQLRFGGRDRPFRKPILEFNYLKNFNQNYEQNDENNDKNIETRHYNRDRHRKTSDYQRDRHQRHDRERSKDNRSRDRYRSRDRSRDRDRYRDRSRDRDHRKYNRSRERSRDRRDRNRDKGSNRGRSRDGSRDRSREGTRDRSREGSRESSEFESRRTSNNRDNSSYYNVKIKQEPDQ